MDKFWQEQFDKHSGAEGVDFVPIGWWPWSPGLPIHQTNSKEDFEHPLAVPRSNYFFWKMVGGQKQYILTPQMESVFSDQFCKMCGSQRCPADSEAIATCGHYNRRSKKMDKVAYVSVTYLFMLEPNEVGIDEDCSKKEFEAAVDGYMNRVFEEVEEHLGAPNDIEVEINGDFN